MPEAPRQGDPNPPVAPSEVIGPLGRGARRRSARHVAIGLQFYISLARSFSPAVVSPGQPMFTLMYFMFVMVGAGGLMVTANLAPIAKDLKVDGMPVTLFGLTHDGADLRRHHRPRPERLHPAVLRLGVGPYRAREHDARRLLHRRRRHLSPLLAGPRSALVRDPERPGVLRLGRDLQPLPLDLHRHVRHQFATTNAGLLYTAKGTAALLVPYTNQIQKTTGSWDTVFVIAAGANILAAVLAVAVLKPWRARVIARG